MIKDKKSLNDEELTEVSGGEIDLSSKKSIGYITVLVDRLDLNYEPKVGCEIIVGLKGETYQIYAIKQNDGKKWFLLDNGFYVAYDPTKMSLVLTFLKESE
jgi:hypothetical protein